MFKKLVFIFDLWKAYSLAGIDDKQTLSLLNKHSNEIEKYEDKFPDYYILRGSIHFDLGNYSVAQNDLEHATQLLTKNQHYNIDEKKYLYSYIYNYLANILYKKDDPEWKIFDDLSKRKNFDLAKVRSNLQHNFPLE
jgi:hypothetical protein